MGITKGTVLITGGSGLIGKVITRRLLERGYAVRWLVRDPSKAHVHGVSAYRWNIGEGYLDPAALEGTDAIIHLAGENIGGGRWTKQRKKLLMESRTGSTALLARMLTETPGQVRTFLSASAIGFYGDRPASELITETSTPGDDFLAQVTKAWEAATVAIALSGRRVITVRIGIVLSANGGALQELARPVKWFVGSPLGSGDQVMSWIHEEDLAGAFIHLLEHEETSGVYNAVAPEPVTNRVLVTAIGHALNRPVLLPPVPALVLKLLLGELSLMVLAGSRVSGKKLEASGYAFRFREVAAALSDIFSKTS